MGGGRPARCKVVRVHELTGSTPASASAKPGIFKIDRDFGRNEMNQFQFSFNKQDEYWTPRYAVEPIVDYLKPGSRIWCPFDTEGSQYVQTVCDRGFSVVYGHLKDGHDFFNYKL